MAAPALPAEIIDMILDNAFYCRFHPWSSLSRPCQNGHTPSQLPPLLAMRLVSKLFNARLCPSLFRDIACRRPPRRNGTLVDLSHHHLASFVKVLRFEIAPRDLKGQSMRVNTAAVDADKKLMHYFEVLSMFLKPVLRRYTQVEELHITSTYDGILEKRIPKNDAMDACLEALCRGVRGAKMPNLDQLVLGCPYEGGYTSFFEDLDNKKYTRLLSRCGKKLRTASVKLFDHQNNFTTMPFF